MNINENYLKLEESYLFSTIAQKVNNYVANNPKKGIIRLGIGDVTRPLVPAVIKAMALAVEEMGHAESFRGYGDEQGYPFLRQAICGYYSGKNVNLEEDEVFVSDGAKSDLGNILDIFSSGNTVLIPDPVYPAYVDVNIMAGRKIIHATGNEENHFLPLPDEDTRADVIYLCSPNNPTGAVYSKEQLECWVRYAQKNNALILFDSAYEIFIRDEHLPSSIYQIDGAKSCSIEFCSFSKMAGFTGTRCGYTLVPRELKFGGVSINKLWLRRQTTKFNGVPYVVQRAAEAVFSSEGMLQINHNIDYYMENAKLIADGLTKLGIWFCGAKNSPYIWLKCPNGMSSWEFFDHLLENAGIVGTPGTGFGSGGEGFFRLTAFGSREDTLKALQKPQLSCYNTGNA